MKEIDLESKVRKKGEEVSVGGRVANARVRRAC
jgi:hypothetical protein